MKKSLLIVLLLLCLCGCDENKGVKVGQVWRDTGNDNPFLHRIYSRQILEVKNGYARYKVLGLENSDEHTMSCNAVKFHSELVENPVAGIDILPDGSDVFTEKVVHTQVKPNEPPIWGEGELPEDFVSYFGTGNNARLNKAQSDLLNQHQALFFGVDIEEVHEPGLIDMINDMNARIKTLEGK